MPEATCLQCGRHFQPCRGGSNRGLYCSRPCAQRHLAPTRRKVRLAVVYTRYCTYCTAPMYRRSGHGTCCSQRCAWRRRQDLPRWCECAECAEPFDVLTRGLAGKFCSASCRAKRNGRIQKRRRRHALRGQANEPVDINRVAERDGWRCHICKRKVSRKTWSLDHLVPVSYGGSHTYANVALAHHHCNTRRSNTGAAQLLLIGS